MNLAPQETVQMWKGKEETGKQDDIKLILSYNAHFYLMYWFEASYLFNLPLNGCHDMTQKRI